MCKFKINRDIARAVLAFAREHGRYWKRELSDGWVRARYPGLLQCARNSYGPEWLQKVTIAELEAAASAE